MTVLEILQVGHPLLRKVATHVTPEELKNTKTQRFIDNLIETMRHANGAGLAATQVGIPLRICVIEVNQNPRYPYKPNIPLTVLVNPILTPIGHETFQNYEGCLSVPNLRGIVPRYGRLKVAAVDRNGTPISEEVSGFKAGTYQHEVDHLNGQLFIDRVKDPKTFATWQEYERHHKDEFVKYAQTVIQRFET